MRFKFVETTALMRNIWNDQFRILGTFNNSVTMIDPLSPYLYGAIYEQPEARGSHNVLSI